MKRQSNTLNRSYFLGAISGCVFLFGLMAFVTVLNTGPGISQGKEMIVELIQANTAEAATAPVTPVDAATQGRDYASNPLTIAEKAEMAPKLYSALGPLSSEWKLRSFKRADLFALFPSLTKCGLFSPSEDGCLPAIPIGSKGMWTYARGDERISGMITYRRSSTAKPEGKIASVPTKPDMYSVIFRAGPPSLSWGGKSMHGNFEIRTREFTDEMRTQMPTLELYRVELEGDGDVQIYLASNTDRATTMAVLDNLDMGLINAMVAPVP